MTGLPWYTAGRTVHAQRGNEKSTRDPVVSLCSNADIAQHIVDEHNKAVRVANTYTRMRAVTA